MEFLAHFMFLVTVYFSSVKFTSASTLPTQKFRPAVCKTGPDDVNIWGISYNDCIEECLSRLDMCESVSFWRAYGNCRIHTSNATWSSKTECRGKVYSEKSSWTVKSLPGCASGTCSPLQTCNSRANSSSDPCSFQECQGLPSIDGGTVYGNVATVNSKLTVRMDDKCCGNTGPASIRCLSNGTWENATCQPMDNCQCITCGNLTPLPFNSTVYCTMRDDIVRKATIIKEISKNVCQQSSNFVPTGYKLYAFDGCRAVFKVCF